MLLNVPRWRVKRPTAWLLSAALCSILTDVSVAQTMSSDQFRSMLELTLKEHPEIVQRALIDAASRSQAANERSVQSATAAVSKEAQAEAPEMPLLGNPRARHTLIEALDYRCPYCKLMFPRVNELLLRRPDVRVAVMMTPILGEDSIKLARFALAADEQGKFEQAHRALLSATSPVPATDEGLSSLASQLGIDWKQAKSAMISARVERILRRDAATWQRLDQPGTPHLIYAGKALHGAAETDALVAFIEPTKK